MNIVSHVLWLHILLRNEVNTLLILSFLTTSLRGPYEWSPPALSLKGCKYFKCSKDPGFRDFGTPERYDAVYDEVIRRLEKLASFTWRELMSSIQSSYWEHWEDLFVYDDFALCVRIIFCTLRVLLDALGTSSVRLYRK